MSGARTNYSAFTVKVNGQYLPEAQKVKVVAVTVDRSIHLPDAATIVIRDLGAGSSADPLNLGLTNQNVLPIGADLEIAMGDESSPKTVFTGEVTAHELEVGHDSAALLVVRGYDKAHRLQRGRNSATFLNVKDSDIATKVARDAGLQAQVESTTEVFPYVLQNNQTNWEFLRARARRIGYEIFVDDKKLVFRKPKPDEGEHVTAQLWEDIRHLNLRMSSAGQVDKVTVRSWDPKAKQAVTGSASKGAPTAHGGQQQSGAELAKPFGKAGMVLSNHPTASQGEATVLAQAMADDLAGNAVQLEAEVPGNPDLKPGQVIKLDRLGPRFNGQYYLTGVIHRFGANQIYTTVVQVGGRRSNSLLELVSAGNGQQDGHGGAGAVVVGVVTNNKDEADQGRVKVKFPWLADSTSTQIESTWARLVKPGAGAGRGVYWMPEINDEVLVAFEHGDVHRPFVLGAVWNGKDAPPKSKDDVVGADGKVNLRLLKSRSGHTITMDDTEGAENTTVVSKSGHLIKLDDPAGTESITIKSQGGHQVKLDDASGGKITIVDKSGNNSIVIETSSNKITIKALGSISLSAMQDVEISGLNVSIKAEAQCQIQSTGPTSIKGAIVQLN